MMKKNGTWMIPTLYREWATFMFEDPGPLLADPFFARALDSRQQEVLKSPRTTRRSRATNTSRGIPAF